MEAKLEYWDRLDYLSSRSSLVKYETIQYSDDIDLFEQFYKMNNRLRYCNGSYYLFADPDMKAKYNEWLKSDDYNKKSFDLYYGNGVVD